MRNLIPLCVFMFAVAFLEVSAQEKTSQPAPAENVQAANAEADQALAEEDMAVGENSGEGGFLNGLSGKLMMYIPNRVVDLFDIFSLEIKCGAAIGAEFRITRAFGLGGEIGATGSIVKGYNRQYGLALTQGMEGQVMFATGVDLQRPIVYGNVDRFWIYGSNFPLPDDRIYKEKIRDYWAIELGAVCLAGAKVSIHPLSFVDFFAGLILLDPEKDDFTLYPFAND